MKKLFFASVILICGFCYGQVAKTSHLEKYHYSLSKDVSTSLQCIGSILTSPLGWNSLDGIKAGGVVIGVAGSFLLDDETRELVLRNKSRFNENVIVKIGHPYSTVLYVGPAALIFYLSGAVCENLWIRKTGQMLVEAVITTGVIQVPLSITIGRARPFYNEGNNSFKLFAGTDDNRASFFSGHSMIAFSFSTILSGQIDNVWASVGLYTLALLGPFARLYKDKHWFSDTVLGSALGIFVGNSILKWHQGKDDIGSKFNFIPLPNGISVSWIF
jgi:membrane-associated phospholipid phosphatase